MAKIGLPKGSGKWLKVREKSVKSQGILKWILSGNPVGQFLGPCHEKNCLQNLSSHEGVRGPRFKFCLR